MADAKNIIEILTDGHHDRNAQLEAVRNLKKLFKPPDSIFAKLKLESLLRGARISLENKPPENDFLYSYGTSLVSFIGRDATLNSEILHQVELILGELKRKDENLTEELIKKLWTQLERGSAGHPDGILDASTPAIETAVLEWTVGAPDNRMEFLSRTSADSPKLFQTLTSILYEVLVRTRGHVKTFEVTASYVEAVKRACHKKGKSFLALYPKGCRRLVALMRLPPELCSQGKGDIKNEVVSLLLEMFLADRKRALILLSHFTKWVHVFKVHLEQSDVSGFISDTI